MSHDSQPVFNDVSYILEKIDPTYNTNRVIGVFEAQGLANMAKDKFYNDMSEDDYDRGVFCRTTAYQTGILYP